MFIANMSPSLSISDTQVGSDMVLDVNMHEGPLNSESTGR